MHPLSPYRQAYGLYLRVRYPRFYALRKEARGMLNPVVYKKMYDLARDLPDLDIVEIGGAAGAGSIALAWALKDSGKSSKLIVVEKCEGGTRSKFGDYDDNLQTIHHNLERFGVRDQIVVFPHELTFENGGEVTSLVRTRQIAALIHDADGRLDRDFALFWPLLRPGGLIIVDDYENKTQYKPGSRLRPHGGIKKVLTYRLVNKFIEWGLFEPYVTLRGTVFGYKPPHAEFKLFDLDACSSIVEEVERERRTYLAQRGVRFNGGGLQ